MRISMTRLILYVRDVARLKAFYETNFGFRVVEEIDCEWAVLMAGQVELALHLAGQPFRALSPAPVHPMPSSSSRSIQDCLSYQAN